MRNDLKFHYGEPKSSIFDRAQNLTNVVVIGRDKDGRAIAWSSLDEQGTQALLNETTAQPVG
jgi:hypothetical protein